jgi:hypothetical protein
MKKDTRKFGISDKRGRQQTSLNPFMPQEGLKEPSICTSCKTVYHLHASRGAERTVHLHELQNGLSKQSLGIYP